MRATFDDTGNGGWVQPAKPPLGRRRHAWWAVILAIMAFGFTFAPLFGTHDVLKVFLFLAIGFSLTGLTYGPIGSALASLFPTAVRYTGTSLTFNFAGILGASLAPLIATHLSSTYGLKFVGYYLSGVGLVTLVALLLMPAKAAD